MPHYHPAQGATLIIPHVFTTVAGAPLDLTGYSVWWTLKERYSDADVDAAINHYWSAADSFGMSLVDPESEVASPITAGILYNHITPDETRSLNLYTRYRYDLWLRDLNNIDRRIERGTIRVESAVRERTTVVP